MSRASLMSRLRLLSLLRLRLAAADADAAIVEAIDAEWWMQRFVQSIERVVSSNVVEYEPISSSIVIRPEQKLSRSRSFDSTPPPPPPPIVGVVTDAFVATAADDLTPFSLFARLLLNSLSRIEPMFPFSDRRPVEFRRIERSLFNQGQTLVMLIVILCVYFVQLILEVNKLIFIIQQHSL